MHCDSAHLEHVELRHGVLLGVLSVSVREENDVALESLNCGVLAYDLMILELRIQDSPGGAD